MFVRSEDKERCNKCGAEQPFSTSVCWLCGNRLNEAKLGEIGDDKLARKSQLQKDLALVGKVLTVLMFVAVGAFILFFIKCTQAIKL